MGMNSAERSRRLRLKRIKSGLCVSCGKIPPELNRMRCAGCTCRHNKDSATRNYTRRSNGLCRCGALAEHGYKTCEKHLDLAIGYYEQNTAKSLIASVCKRCGDVFEAGHCAACKEFISNTAKKYRKKLRDEVFSHYGHKCKCCGESEEFFLTIDHINNDGAAHRRSLPNGKYSTGERMYRWLKVNGYPDGFQVLCMNCNLGKQRNGGICPHQMR